MELYEILIDAKLRMVVRAENAMEAKHLATRGVLEEYPRVYRVNAEAVEANKATRADYEAGLVKSETQVCEWCGVNDHKSQWGPGYMVCPGCGRHPRTAAEAHQHVYNDAEGIDGSCACERKQVDPWTREAGQRYRWLGLSSNQGGSIGLPEKEGRRSMEIEPNDVVEVIDPTPGPYNRVRARNLRNKQRAYLSLDKGLGEWEPVA